jgi:molecular chaperone GrpE
VAEKEEVNKSSAPGADLAADAQRASASADSAGIAGLPLEPAEGAVQRLEEEIAELRDRHLRLAAEYDNFRKRSTRERAEAGDRGKAELLGRLLDVLDDFDRLVDGGGASQTVDQLHEAVVLTDKKLWRELEQLGLEAIEPTGAPFNPTEHEAISTVPAPAAERAHTVAQTFQIGYRLKGILLRPARVAVYGEPVQA